MCPLYGIWCIILLNVWARTLLKPISWHEYNDTYDATQNRHEEVALPLTTSPCPSAPVSFRGSPTPKWSSYSNRLWTYSKKLGALNTCIMWNIQLYVSYRYFFGPVFKCILILFFWGTHQKLHGSRFQTASSLWSVG